MGLIWDGFTSALRLLWNRDPETMEILWLSLRVSLSATVIALLIGLPVGMLIAVGRFPGRKLLLAVVNTGMGLPPVVAGLFVTLLLWRSGPLGAAGLLYTPTAMIIAQAFIATPLVAGISTPRSNKWIPSSAHRCSAWAPGASEASTRLPVKHDCRCSQLSWRASEA